VTIVSGATLKTSMSTAETALDTLIAIPTQANLNSAVSALDTVVTNAKDSRLIQSSDPSARRIHSDFNRSANALRQELLNSAGHHASASQPVGPSSIYKSIKRTYVGGHGPWIAYKGTPTTD
jgi:hypothetical protein